MKLRIQQRPSLIGNPRVHWYHAQVRRFGIWVDCFYDPILDFKYSTTMMVRSHDTCFDVVENFVQHVLRGEEMYPKTDNTVVAEYGS